MAVRVEEDDWGWSDSVDAGELPAVEREFRPVASLPLPRGRTAAAIAVVTVVLLAWLATLGVLGLRLLG